jgi:ABC-type bacteriocin/lantibiotic exporter with double-glycine peptidase domain
LSYYLFWDYLLIYRIKNLVNFLRLKIIKIFSLLFLEAFFNTLSIFILFPLLYYLSGTQSNFGNFILNNTLFPKINFFLLIMSIIFIVVVFKFVISFFSINYINKFIKNIRISLTNDILRKIIGLNIDRYNIYSNGYLLNLSTNEVVASLRLFKSFFSLISSLIMFFLIFSVTVFIEYKIAIIVFVTSFLYIYFANKPSISTSHDLSKKKVKTNSKLNELFNILLNNYREIFLLRLQNYYSKEINIYVNHGANINYKSYNSVDFPKIYIEFFAFLTFLIVVFILSLFAIQEALLPVLVMYFILFYKSNNLLNSIFLCYIRISQDYNSFEEILKFLASTKTVKFYNSLKINFKKGSMLSIKDLYFKYPNSKKIIFRKFNLQLKLGSLINLTGNSGSGKSTLVDIICGFRKPDSMKYYINGIIIDDKKDNKYLLQYFGYVSQDFKFINGNLYTLFKNISPTISNKFLINILNVTECLCFLPNISNFQNFKNYELSKYGSNISGGQRKRLSIALALAKSPNVLILDEVFSNIEQDLEYKIINNLRNFDKNMTIINITHRINPKIKYDQSIIL